METMYSIIKKPLISEKSTALAEVAGKYVFEVLLSANKFQIKDAVEKLFGVDVKKVATSIVHGKVKRRGKFEVKKTNWKKAIVTLSEGQKIDFFQK